MTSSLCIRGSSGGNSGVIPGTPYTTTSLPLFSELPMDRVNPCQKLCMMSPELFQQKNKMLVKENGFDPFFWLASGLFLAVDGLVE